MRTHRAGHSFIGRASASGAHKTFLAIATVGVLAGCESSASTADAVQAEIPSEVEIPVIPEVYETLRDTLDNIDSPVVWHGGAGEHWVLATAKEGDVVVVFDAATGAPIRRVGSEGAAIGQMDRPNGVAVVDDLLFVVERDNARVQVFSLPGFEALGVYGGGDLRKPYGIAVVTLASGEYSTYVTDNYEFEEDVIPADSLLGERVRQYNVRITPGGPLTAQLERTFGDTEGEGVLRVVESIAVDPPNGRLIIAEEQEGASMLKVYSLEGVFSGEIVPERFFPNQAEGVVLYTCGESEGYWIATDQGTAVNTFHVFDRMSLAHVGSFRGARVMNTDGIALTQQSFGNFDGGAFIAVHDDGSVVAFSWQSIAESLGLRSDCAA